MSLKERKRMVVMAEVKAKKMSVREAAVIMGMGSRQAKRVWRCRGMWTSKALRR